MTQAQRGPGLPARRWRVLLRWSGWALAFGVALSLAVAFGFTLYAVAVLPPLQRWHSERLDGEFSAARHAALDFAGYQRLEAQLFDELDKKTAAWARDASDAACARPAASGAPASAPLALARAGCAPGADEALANSRFSASGWLRRLVDGAPYNRSFRLTLAQPLGHALLVHGLTDSPHSMKAMAQSLRTRGFEVTVLRLPGHGTLPSMMAAMSARDWSAAVRRAANDVASRTPATQPFYVGGYSSGGTLALSYALDALQDSALRRPDRVLLVSPAIELTPVAKLAEIIDIFAIVPLPVLDKVHWQDIAPEFDPYKFNSFPVNASRQINRATQALHRSLVEAERAGRLVQLPPIVAWQSVVDSTVGSLGVSDRLYARLRDPAHRLVMLT